jgi:type VI protein secretion system component VasF
MWDDRYDIYDEDERRESRRFRYVIWTVCLVGVACMLVAFAGAA